LRDALDHSALSGGVPALEKHHQLVAGGHDPFLQLDELTLHPEKFPEVLPAFRFKGVLFRLRFGDLPIGKDPILNLHLKLFVEPVDQVVVNALKDFVIRRFWRIHWRGPSL
jgi:hypothetical protein